ncbi:MAG: shikimate dehydrogenase [SAR202 cluster bacterium Io17-Chloro-G9]|nr:MAG: shikimate dehydrogenase [SAR202 cluster bacterium Io17-Chloro-G9]
MGKYSVDSRLGIIGYPIGHSISPLFQQAALDHAGIDASYRAWEVKPEEVPEFIAGLGEPGVLGINVTVPHKEAVIPHLDEVDQWASTAGAVNTIVNREGRLTGHNTDGLGFLRALLEVNGFAPRGRRVLILGAGGAARGVVLALVREEVSHLTIANRTLSRAERLVQIAEDAGLDALAVPLGGSELEGEAASADLIVNCTTLGLAHGPDEQGSPLSSRQIPPTALVNDLVYNPLATPLLQAAAQAGAQVLGGIHMLVYQGAASYEMWTGQPAPVEVMLQAALEAMAGR